MTSRIRNIWLVWLLVMALLVGITWLLMLFPLPGGSAGTPTFEEFLGFFEHIGVLGTIEILVGLLAPPIVLTCWEIWKVRSRGY